MTPHLLPRLTHITYADMSTRVSQNAPKCEFSKTFLGIAVSIPKSHPKKISRVLRHFWRAAIIFPSLPIILYGFLWFSLIPYGYLWLPSASFGTLWLHMDVYSTRLAPMAPYNSLRFSIRSFWWTLWTWPPASYLKKITSWELCDPHHVWVLKASECVWSFKEVFFFGYSSFRMGSS